MPFSLFDTVGYAAAAASLLAFCARDMIPLRTAMLVSNVLFIAWALIGGLTPPLLLHATLLPVNAVRLWRAMLVASSIPVRRRREATDCPLRTLSGRTRVFDAGEPFWRAGAQADTLWLILGGAGRCALVADPGHFQAAGTCEATRVAPAPLVAARIDAAEMRASCRADPDLSLAIAAALAETDADLQTDDRRIRLRPASTSGLRAVP